MMLAHPILGKPMMFEENRVSVLVVENQEQFSAMIIDLLNQLQGNQGEFVLSENFHPLVISKQLELIGNPLLLDFSQKRIANKLVAELESIAVSETMFGDTVRLQGDICTYLQSLTAQSAVPLKYNGEIGITALLKAVNVSPDYEESTLLQRISEYMRLIASLSLASCFVFVNLKTFLTEKELELLYNEIGYKKYSILLLENTMRDTMRKKEKTVLMDKDLCEVINEN